MTFDVTYTITNQAAAEETVVRDLGIKSDRIRLLAEADGIVPGYEAPGDSGTVVPKKDWRDEHTGEYSFDHLA